jgi:spermidine synthase
MASNLTPGSGVTTLRAGLGSGAMPAFIAKHFPNTTVEVVEIDPVVAEVGLYKLSPFSLPKA